MTLAPVIAAAACLVEIALAALAVGAVACAAYRFRSDDLVEGTVLVGLGVLAAFAMISLDAARRSAGL